MRRSSTLAIAAFLCLFATAAWSGDVKKGWDAYNKLDYAAAMAEWQELADAGNADAAYGMGMLYGNGFGVDMNDELALKYYGLAAEKGNADAAFNLAVMYQNGWGVAADEVIANDWYRLAAEKGNAQAQMALGRYFAMDFLDSYDPVLAYKWFSLAEKLGDLDAIDKRAFIAGRMTTEQKQQGDRLVDEFVKANEGMFAGLDFD